jgi:hypothetical protein
VKNDDYSENTPSILALISVTESRTCCYPNHCYRTGKHGFDPGSARVTFVVKDVIMWQVFLRVLRFLPVSIIPPVLHNHLDFNTTLVTTTYQRSEHFDKWKLSYMLCNTGQNTSTLLPVCVRCVLMKRGTRWRSWLRHCATSRKVAGSIPDGVTETFQWLNPSGRTMIWSRLCL